MNNEDIRIEEILRHYKLSSAPISLKDRIFQTKKSQWNKTWLVAASIVVVVGLGLTWRISLNPPSSEINDPKLVCTIIRTGKAAQLLALADFWANQPEGKNHAQQIYIEVANSFSDLNAGKQAQLRLKSF